MNLDRRLLEWGRFAWGNLFAAGAAGFGVGLLAIGQAWLLSSLIAAVFLQGQDLAGAMPRMWVLLGVFLGRALLVWAQEAFGSQASALVRRSIRSRLLEQLQRKGPVDISQEHTGELVATLLQGVDALDAFYGKYLPQVFLAVLVPFAILAVVFPIDLLSGAVFLLTAPLIPLFMVLIGRTAENVTRTQFIALGRMSAFFLDTLLGLTTLKQLNQSESRMEMIARISEEYRAKTMQVLRLTFLSALALELAATISTAVVAVEIALRLLAGAIEFQPAFFILMLAPEFYLPLRLLGQRYHAGAAAGAGAARIQAMLMASTITISDVPPPTFTAIAPPRSIRFEQVGFRYPDRQAHAVEEVSLELHNGELTALVGQSGAGKSTLVYLLLGFLCPQEGRILVDGIDLKTIPLSEWRRRLAYVPQQPYLFQDTLAVNIRLGRPEASFDEVRQAARLVGLDDFISQLPRGYDTLAGERGAKLSSGQIQRVALARAFLKNAPVLILDEPASRLDPELEQTLAEAIRLLCQNKIGVVIAHRAASVWQADRVVLLHEGRVAEKGAPQELQDLGGAFAALMGGAR